MKQILDKVNEIAEVLNSEHGVPNMEWVKNNVNKLQEVVKEKCNLLDVMPRISPEECDCINLVHKIDRDQFPYGNDLEYDECPKCKARYHLKVV